MKLQPLAPSDNVPEHWTLPTNGNPGNTNDGTDRIVLYHGTSVRACDDPTVPRVYQESNVSLGGVYLTVSPRSAQSYGDKAAKKHESETVVLAVAIPETMLEPDEDWVVKMSQECEYDEEKGRFADRRLGAIFDKIPWQGDGTSLSDAYKEVYTTVNKRYNITFQDSLRWTGTARVNWSSECEAAHCDIEALLNPTTQTGNENP